MPKARQKSSRVGQEVAQITRALRAVTFPRLTRAILFGSRARGESLETSDYDLILVSPDFEGMNFHDRIVRALEQLSDLTLPLDILCYTPSELARKAREIGTIRQAVREGTVLLKQDAAVPRHTLKVKK